MSMALWTRTGSWGDPFCVARGCSLSYQPSAFSTALYDLWTSANTLAGRTTAPERLPNTTKSRPAIFTKVVGVTKDLIVFALSSSVLSLRLFFSTRLASLSMDCVLDANSAVM